VSDSTELEILDEVIQDFAPEVADLYYIREDESEEQQIKTGRLHENRILGIILKYYLEGEKKVTTSEVEKEYKKYFKDIARSTISTYLNMLKKESTLYKERDGRIVYYIFFEEPPEEINPFWFTRIFCIVPAYFVRAIFFARLYKDSEEIVNKFGKGEDLDIQIKNFKFLIGLIILLILKNRSSKCVLCQFSKREIYNQMQEALEQAIKDRSDVLPKELIDFLINFGEIPIFGGENIDKKNNREKLTDKILIFADDYKKDLEFQIMVSGRRTDIRLREKERKETQEDIPEEENAVKE